MRRPGIIVAALAAFAMATSVAVAQPARTVTFAPGATSATLKGTVRGSGDVAYAIDAVAGQPLRIRFRPSNRSCYFNLTAPGAAEATHIGSVAGNTFSGTLAASGPHRVLVYLMRNAARRGETCRYTLTVDITGSPGTAVPARSDQAVREACRAEAAPMFGVAPRAVRITAPVKPVAAGGFQVDGTVDKGREGIKALRCFLKPDRSFDRIMALTPDGE